MYIALLGPLGGRDGERTVEIPGARLRALLTRLALTPGRLVTTAALVDAVWGATPPAGAPNALQSLVSRLRRGLPDDVLESHPAGYLLRIDPTAVDIGRFEALVAGSGADARSTVERLTEAESLWRGEPLTDLDGAQEAAARLVELRLTATEDRLAVFVGVASPEAAESVRAGAELPALDGLDVVSSLVD